MWRDRAACLSDPPPKVEPYTILGLHSDKGLQHLGAQLSSSFFPFLL